MYEFSALGAWSRGVRFLQERPLQHLILIGGLGLLIPLILQVALRYALTGVVFGAVRPPDAGLAYQLAPAALMVVQTIGLFASWRLGLAERETLGGALLYGLLSALFVLLFTAAPLILLLALFSTLAAATAGAGLALGLAFVMLFGGATGNVGLAATMFGGGSGFVVVLFLLLSVLTLWLAARLGCTTAVMADRKSYNAAAARASPGSSPPRINGGSCATSPFSASSCSLCWLPVSPPSVGA